MKRVKTPLSYKAPNRLYYSFLLTDNGMNAMTIQNSPTDQPQNPAPSWTPEKQREFLEALARCGSVKASAARVPIDCAGDRKGVPLTGRGMLH
jgi:O-glycosyl hydrolase